MKINIEEKINDVLTSLALGMAKLYMAKSCWEGDVREGVYVFAVPGEEVDAEIGFIWKQDNNGTTFILSPRELPWLMEHFILPLDR